MKYAYGALVLFMLAMMGVMAVADYGSVTPVPGPSPGCCCLNCKCGELPPAERPLKISDNFRNWDSPTY